MNTKALIDEEIATLDAKELNIVYQILKKFRQERQLEKKSSVMFQLQQIQVDGPEDWARNLDQYLHGERGLIDCISFVVMREAGVTQALTFDRHFAQAGFECLLHEIT